MPDQLIPYLLELNRQGKFDFGRLCKNYSFKDADRAVKDMLSGAVIKPICEPICVCVRRMASLTRSTVVWD